MAETTKRSHFRRWLGSETEATRIRSGLGAIDRRVAFALMYTALVLAVNEYFFSFPALRRHPWPGSLGLGGEDLGVGLVWVAVRLVLFAVIPGIVVLAGHRERLESIGWSPRGLLRHMRVYLVLYALVLPLVVLASYRTDFSLTYPFVAGARTSVAAFLLWECAYVLSFLALEAFFRGYLLFTCEAPYGVAGDLRDGRALHDDSLSQTVAGGPRGGRGRGHTRRSLTRLPLVLGRGRPARARGGDDGRAGGAPRRSVLIAAS